MVAWRLPLGMSLLKPPSHCPGCKTPIRLRDNVPVLGWILLRGRCRACGCKISPRYPLVELAMGVAFGVLAYYELATAGSIFPPRNALKPIATGLMFDWTLLGVWLYHVTLVSILATIALIESEGSRLTRGFFVFALCAGLLPPVIWPELRVTFSLKANAVTWAADTTVQLALRHLIIGAVLGTCIGWSFDPRRSDRARVVELGAALASVGLFLGDAILLPVAGILAVVVLLLRLIAIAFPVLLRAPRSAIVLPTVIYMILHWPQTVNPFDNAEAYTATVLIVGLVSALLAFGAFHARHFPGVEEKQQHDNAVM